DRIVFPAVVRNVDDDLVGAGRIVPASLTYPSLQVVQFVSLAWTSPTTTRDQFRRKPLPGEIWPGRLAGRRTAPPHYRLASAEGYEERPKTLLAPTCCS